MRVENWDTFLVKFATEVRDTEFEWGVTDCVTIMRGGLKAILGYDPFSGHLRVWKSKTGALRAFNNIAFSPSIILAETGAEGILPNFAWSGDVAVGPETDENGLPAISILLPGRKALVSTLETGVIIIDKLALTKGTEFWRYV
jgi:hypothetical protein